MNLDPRRYPRLSAYLARHPDGLLSHPECEAKASMYRQALTMCPQPLRTDDLPTLLADYVTDPVPVSAWVPEVVNNSIYLAIADQMFPDDEDFLRTAYDVAASAYRSPTYRFLMYVASPKMMANGGSRRWATFHRGTTYEVDVSDNGSTSVFTTPAHLYDRLTARTLARGIQAAYHAVGATEATTEVHDFTPTRIVFRSVWYPDPPRGRS